MNQKILSLCLLAAGFSLAACGGSMLPASSSPTAAPPVSSSGYLCPQPEFPAELTSTELDLFVWTEYIPADMVECFEAVYGVETRLHLYSSNEELYDGIVGGGARYDLILPSDYMIPRLVKENLLQELDHARLPVMKNFNPDYLDFEFDPGNRFTLPYLAGMDLIAVNMDRVETLPQSWADLWNPQYAGRIALLDDRRVVIGAALLSLGYDVNTTDPAQLAEAKTKLEALIPAVKLFDSDSPKTALLAGAVDLAAVWTGEAFIAHQENPQIQIVFPSEGVILWQDNWAILKNAPHADAAYAWLNYVNQGDVFWMVLRDFPYSVPNAAALEFIRENQTKIKDINGGEITLASLYNAYIESPITNPPINVLRTGRRIADVGTAARLYDDLWREVRNGD
ncbi:MAG: spermidine/putrescine ABC transporter substrate-binding protein [Chloroflexi bacterium]|nr:spermidine/putrescine ABC transporter substrate-binding protein [Chloroflexota bacterium]MCA2001986.1 spermidine/putrescine ABC transporter substrate-binding protein [Chloroflexota bacterium]